MLRRRIGWMVGAAVGIVALVALLLPSAERGDGGLARSAPQGGAAAGLGQADASSAALGVRLADVDSAERKSLVVKSPRGLEAVEGPALDDGPTIAVPQPPPVPALVTPPIVPTAEAIAESEAMQAAQPAVKAEVDAWLAKRRPGIRKDCWNGDELPASAEFLAEVTYSEEGKLLAFSLGEVGAPPAVSSCVRATSGLVPPAITPPGLPVRVVGTLTLP